MYRYLGRALGIALLFVTALLGSSTAAQADRVPTVTELLITPTQANYQDATDIKFISITYKTNAFDQPGNNLRVQFFLASRSGVQNIGFGDTRTGNPSQAWLTRQAWNELHLAPGRYWFSAEFGEQTADWGEQFARSTSRWTMFDVFGPGHDQNLTPDPNGTAQPQAQPITTTTNLVMYPTQANFQDATDITMAAIVRKQTALDPPGKNLAVRFLMYQKSGQVWEIGRVSTREGNPTTGWLTRTAWNELGLNPGRYWLSAELLDQTSDSGEQFARSGSRWALFDVLGPGYDQNIAPYPSEPTRYTLSLDNIRIDNTRSSHTDTDYVSFSLKVGDQKYPTLTKSMGDLNNGTFNVGLFFGSIPVNDNTPVVLDYLVVNAGHSVGEDIAKVGLTELGDELLDTYVDPTMVLSNIYDLIIGMAFANCDGVVAEDRVVTDARTLASWTAGGPHSETRFYPGSDSPAGCGSNSRYSVTWSVRSMGPAGFDVKPFPTRTPQGTTSLQTVVNSSPSLHSGWLTSTLAEAVGGSYYGTFNNTIGVDSTATWAGNIAQSTYRAQAFIPRNGSYPRTHHAQYQIDMGGATAQVSISQDIGSTSEWVDLGTFTFNGHYQIMLTDETGEPQYSHTIVANAVRFIPVNSRPQ
jgi:hypothetical protein